MADNKVLVKAPYGTTERMVQKFLKFPPTLMFGRAINYALSAWNHLLNYLDCPELFVDNSIAERSIKPFVIGRKNWLFSQDLKLAPKVPVSYLLLLKTQNSIN